MTKCSKNQTTKITPDAWFCADNRSIQHSKKIEILQNIKTMLDKSDTFKCILKVYIQAHISIFGKVNVDDKH